MNWQVIISMVSTFTLVNIGVGGYIIMSQLDNIKSKLESANSAITSRIAGLESQVAALQAQIAAANSAMNPDTMSALDKLADELTSLGAPPAEVPPAT